MIGEVPLSILVVDDEPAHIVAVQRSLYAAWPDAALHTARTLRECRDAVAARRPDIVLIDLNLPDGSAIEFLGSLPESNRFPVVVMTSQGDQQAAVVAMKTGALDYVVKSPMAFGDMAHIIQRALREWRLRQEHRQAAEALLRHEEQLQAIYDNAPVMMCVLNAERQVTYANRAFAEFVGQPAGELQGVRACGVLGCLRALDDPRGCGHGPDCETCPVRLAMMDTLATGRSHRGIDYRTQILEDGKSAPRAFLASVAALRIAEGSHLLLCLQDITERILAEEDLRASREQLRVLAGRLQEVREEERTSVAREIHDVLAQCLTRLKIDLVWLQGRLGRPESAQAMDVLAARAADMTRLADEAIHSVQTIATALRPAVLDSLGLFAAADWQVRDFQESTGITCEGTLREDDLPVAPDTATALFRILQESLTNVYRHAEATRVRVFLGQEDGDLVLRIQDDGQGIPPAALNAPRSIGLAGMRERALLLGGRCDIVSSPESGTAIEVRLPRGTSGNMTKDAS
jgi:signal transduction histidine kinase